MQKTICGKLYDTETSAIVKKVTFGNFGEPCGYEETLYVTDGGNYFLYTNGGEDSPYKAENIKRMSKKAADEWVASH
ncbi:MAG: hypothetical protein E7667_06775 [Ruminococcaceae bacterium]|nr:hypothetical protein [Oscillospiraceae bacterium]